MVKYQKKRSGIGYHNRFEYFVEDCLCSVCLYYKGKKLGCTLTACCCEDIKLDALAHGRIKRDQEL